MNLPKLSIERPVFVSCLIGLILVLGVMAFFTLGVDQFPTINMPVVNVVVPYRGAGPEEVETLVVKPLEDELSGLEGIKKITSSCLDGAGQITIQFTLETDAKDAERRVRDRVALVRPKLPTAIDEPSIRRFDPSDSPIAILTLESDLPAVKAYDFADDILKPRLTQVKGVGSVHLMGGTKREIQVLLDRDKLNRYQIGVNTVAGRIGSNSQNVPLGKVERGDKNMTFRAIGEYRDLDRIRETVVSFAGSDVAVSVDRLGQVVDGEEEKRNHAFYNGKSAIVFIIYKQSGANTVEVVDQVLRQKDVLNEEFKSQPGSPRLNVAMENAWMIRAILGNVEEAIAVAILLTMLVVYLFLGSGISALITLTAIPVSFLGAFATMQYFGFTLNTLTLIALSLAVGLLVDDAIVVRENIWRHMEEGMPPKKAALQGTLQVAMAVVATTSVIIAVFLPIAFMKGVVGQFFKEFGLTMVFAVAVSFLVAMTLGPMLSAYLVPKRKPGHEKGASNSFLALFDRFQTWLENRYVGVVRACIRHRLWVVLAAVGVFFASLGLIKYIPFSFMPKMEVGYFMLSLKAAPGINLEAMKDKSVALGEQIRKHPEVKYVCALVGDTSGTGGKDNTSMMLIQLVSEKERSVGTSAFMEMLREELEPYQRELQPQIANYDPMNSGAPFTMNLKGKDYAQLVEWSERVKEEMKKVPGLTDIVTNYDGGKAEFQAKFDPLRLKTMGVLGTEAGGELRAQVDGVVAAKYRENGLEYDLRVRLQPDQRDVAKDFGKVMVPNQNKRMVRLSKVAEGVEAVGPAVINRYNRSRYIQVTAQIKKGGALGDSITEAQRVMAGMQLPPGMTYEFVGQAEDMNDLVKSMGLAVLLAILLTYMILASLYESPITPITIMTAIPLAIVGAFFALWATGQQLDIFSMISLLMLLGLVTKNSILLVDFIQQMRAQGMGRTEAIVEAGRVRLRPILMTTLALVAGLIPMVLTFSEISHYRVGMGWAQIGGLLSSLFLTLLVVPATYGYVDDLRLLFRKWVGLKPGPEIEPAEEGSRALSTGEGVDFKDVTPKD